MMNSSIKDQLSALTLFPFCSEDIFYYHSGRNALWHTMKFLNLSPNDEVLVPSYNCGAEIDPIVKWGTRVRLYTINSELGIDFDELKEKINRNTRAILVIHYFGFPQPVDILRKICDENGVYLIEDCAHALFSTYKNKPLGSFGDIAIFSLKKFLPVPDGGILAINNNNLQHPEELMYPPLLHELTILAEQFLLRITGINNRALLLTHKFITDLFKKTRFNTEPGHQKNLNSTAYDSQYDLIRSMSSQSFIKPLYPILYDFIPG